MIGSQSGLDPEAFALERPNRRRPVTTRTFHTLGWESEEPIDKRLGRLHHVVNKQPLCTEQPAQRVVAGPDA